MKSLNVTGVTKGARVTVTCKGKGCAFKTKTVTAKGTTVSLKSLFKGKRLATGARITIKVGTTKIRYTTQKGAKKPKTN